MILISYLAFSSIQSKIRYDSINKKIDEVNDKVEDLSKKVLLVGKDSLGATDK
ncbi:MAG: hypothetical protein OXH57_01610 [Ekhidna sp.]|nr:hypothetical protein [Ekhidna sp.]